MDLRCSDGREIWEARPGRAAHHYEYADNDSPAQPVERRVRPSAHRSRPLYNRWPVTYNGTRGEANERMEIQTLTAAQINPAPYNPRKNLQPGDPEFEKLKRSIETFGYVEPLVWNQRTGNLVGGHQRYKVLSHLGRAEFEAVVVDLDDNEERALNVALNKVSGAWDEEALAVLLRDLGQSGYDATLTGFEYSEIDELLRRMNVPDGPPEEGFDADTEYQAIIEPITRPGDIIKLGAHRLMCGDSTTPDVQELMAGRIADLIMTDPPYNVAYEGSNGLTIENDDMDDGAFYAFLLNFYRQAFDASKAGAGIYVFHADSEGLNFRKAMIDAGWLMKQNLIWVKNSLVLGRQDYQWQHEPCLYGWKPGAGHYWNGGRDQTTVNFEDPTMDLKKKSKPELIEMINKLRNAIPSSVIYEDKPKRNDVHPTMKPLPLITRLMKNSSKRGDIVLDPFGGSGSTLVGAEMTGRVCYMMEFDPKYVDVIVKRWEQYTGETAERPRRDER